MTDSLARSLRDPATFTLTYELVPGQGAGGKKIDSLLEFARLASRDGRIRALSITDNAGGHPALAPVAIGSEIRNIGLEPLIHFSLKDKNRNQIESHLFLYQRQGFHNLLVLGGDFPKPTWHGQARPVFDLDTIQTISLIHELVREYAFAMPFHCGCVVSPFKMTEAEQVWQYAKLMKKIRAGAGFIITQVGFVMEKYAELIRFLRQIQKTEQKGNIPVMASVFIPAPGVARFMAGSGVPGVVLPQDLARKMAAEGKKERLIRAARMTAQLRAMGYDGVHLGGNNLCFADIAFVLDQAESMFAKGTIEPEADAAGHRLWFLYTRDGACKPLHPGTRPGLFRLHSLAHHLLFSKKTAVSRLFGRFCRFCDRFRFSRRLFTLAERIIKEILFDCRMCGDCTLAESSFLCPQSGCPKRLVNGPCGGSTRGRCEVFPDRTCFYVRVYRRLDPKTSLQGLGMAGILPPKDWGLERTSSWINFFKGRDHTAQGDKKGKT
jgi:methylenetetrahydrofolate reductase (NADPH)